ncbi:hypothetical protein ABZ404_36885 [Streptomyces sp. NPDC005878]|uniref:hypothetical protein n=1 Tax=Streptomyces sp. NPDC005878 TaxID=3157077 RepID=UPI0033C475C5
MNGPASQAASTVRTSPRSAMPPIGPDLAGALDDLEYIHPGIDLIRDGIRLLATERLTADRTQTLLAALAGSDGADVLTLLTLLIQRLTDADTNPALRRIDPALLATIRALGDQAAYTTHEFAPRDLVAEASGLIYEATTD